MCIICNLYVILCSALLLLFLFQKGENRERWGSLKTIKKKKFSLLLCLNLNTHGHCNLCKGLTSHPVV